jgi:hypothetical protein
MFSTRCLGKEILERLVIRRAHMPVCFVCVCVHNMYTVDGFGFTQNPRPDIVITERLSKTGAEDKRGRGGCNVCCSMLRY